MNLSPEQRQYLLIGQCAVPFVINVLINGGLGFAMFGADPVTVWAQQEGAGPDLIGTCLFLPLITCLIVTPLVHRNVRGGMVEPLADASQLVPWLRPYQRSLLARALLFGLTGIALLGSAIAIVLLGVGVQELDLSGFRWFKAIFSGVFGAVVTPLIAIVALADRPAPVAT